MPQIPSGSIVARVAAAPDRARALSRWAAQPIQVARGLHFGYFAGYALMWGVAALAIVAHR